MACSSVLPTCGWRIDTGPGAVLFTEAELAAADHLVQLSGSGGWDDASPSSSSSSLLSVNTGAVAWKGEEEVVEEEVLELDRRARKRYRLLADLYAATRQTATGACLGAATTASDARKRKRVEPEGKPAMARYGDHSW